MPRLTFSIVCLLLALVTGARAELGLDELIARNTEAMGGREKIESVQALEIALQIQDPGFEVNGLYRAVRPGKMRIDIQAGGKRVYMERFDGDKAWQWQEGKGEREEGPTPTAALRHGVELPGKLFGLHELPKRGHRLELKGRENLDGVEYYVIGLTLADGDTSALYLDPQSWRITRRRDERALHPDVDPTKKIIESRMLDWREVEGRWFSFAGEDVDVKTGKVLETTQIKELKVNPRLDPDLFTKE